MSRQKQSRSKRKEKRAANKRARSQSRVSAFAAGLDAYEETMGEGAAMALMCEQEGIDMDEGYLLLADEGDDEGYPPPCSDPSGHSWVENEETGASYCEYCCADGDA